MKMYVTCKTCVVLFLLRHLQQFIYKHLIVIWLLILINVSVVFIYNWHLILINGATSANQTPHVKFLYIIGILIIYKHFST